MKHRIISHRWVLKLEWPLVTIIVATMVLAASADPTNCAPAPSGLVGWWQAEANALDAIGGNNGTPYNGVGFAPGRVGQAFSFNGTNSYVEVSDSPSLRLTNELTIECWIKRQHLQTTDYIINKGGDWTGSSLNYGVSISHPNYGSRLEFLSQGCSRHSSAITDFDWHHLAVVARQGDVDPTFYLDGVQQPVTARAGKPTINLYPSTRPLHIGAQVDPVTGWFYYCKTLIDEISLYSRALSAAEIQAIYGAGGAGKCGSGVAPVITTQPASQTVAAGATATFTVTAAGTPPLSYQWCFAGTNIAGATGSSLTLSNVQVAQAGSYAVQVTNAFGLALSSNAILTVANSAPQCVTPPAGLVSWWAGQGNALDSVGTNNGVLQGGMSFVAGEVGQAFRFNGTDASVRVPGGSSLNVGVGDGLTIEGWINPAEVASQHPIAEWSSPSWFNAHFWIATPVEYGGGGPGSLYANLIDTTGAYHQIASAGGVVLANRYQHVAVTYDKGSGNAVLYLSGAVVKQANLGSFTPLTTGDLHLGLRPVGGAAGTRFVGQMDEMSIYGRALTAGEIAAICGAGSAGKCPTTPPPPPPQTNCVNAPSGLVSWWRGEGDASDSVGGNNGTLEGGTVFVAGEVGQAFSFNGVDADVRVPADSSLNVGLGAGLTIEGWINPAEVNSQHPIVEWSSPAWFNAHFWVATPVAYGGGGPGSLYANLMDTTGGYHQIASAGGVLMANTYQHVAVTYDKGSGNAVLYLDGVVVKEASLGSFTPLTTGDLHLGLRPVGGAAGTRFVGQMDEISLYNRALSAAEIQAIYGAGSAGKCMANGTPVAICADVIVSADTNCQANASINNGSFDPDGEPITVNQVPPGPYPVGTNHVFLIVSDNHGASNACSALVIVQDRTSPVIICASNKVVECGTAWTFDPPVAFDNCGATNVLVSVVSTLTNVGCGGSFTATRTWAAVDSFTNTAACSQSVAVLDTTPPTIVCPASLTVEFQDETGAVVPFVVTASDTCSAASLVVTPPSGSRFPIGVTPVQATALDACTNASQCGFAVTVLGAQGVKSNVLAELIALRAASILDESFAAKFDYAIEHLQASLDSAYWVDQTHLQVKSGNAAMNEEKLAANRLAEIMEAKECPVEAPVLQGFIDRIVKCDRLLAMISIQDAASAGLNPRKVAEDMAMVAKGDQEAAAGRYASAIEHYRNAWRHALQLQLQVRVNADGSTRLHFVDNGSKSYLIEVSTDLVNWVSLGTCAADADGQVDFTDPSTATQSVQFYRVVEQ